jgi:hypothetical protein
MPLGGCQKAQGTLENPTTEEFLSSVERFEIVNGGRITLEVGNSYQLLLDSDKIENIQWKSSSDAVKVDSNGLVTALAEGKAAVVASNGSQSASVLIEVVPASAILDDAERKAFYQNYTLADSHAEALERSEQGLMSGSLETPHQKPTIPSDQPMQNGALIRNGEALYADENTYVLVDVYGNEVMRIYRGGAYITLEEVAAYVFAFGDVPANYISGKNAEPEDSIWGEYLRLNHSKFSGNTQKYPYEPALPNISGCGGDLQYYEIDIGTTGTDCDPAYVARIYNDGQTITRGAARIVYTRYDKNGNQILEPDEKYVFYTYNHYNDFQEYLNYYGGWGEMFGNITGGGTISSKTDYNPTPYIPSVIASLKATGAVAEAEFTVVTMFCLPTRWEEYVVCSDQISGGIKCL